jgi:hypothetical protein
MRERVRLGERVRPCREPFDRGIVSSCGGTGTSSSALTPCQAQSLQIVPSDISEQKASISNCNAFPPPATHSGDYMRMCGKALEDAPLHLYLPMATVEQMFDFTA